MESAAEVAAALRRDGVECQALDIGGGFPIKYSDDVPPIEEIANEVYEVFNARFPKETELLIEPGRCIVGESAVLASTVIGRARRGDEDWLFLDASAFHGLLEAQQVKGRFPYPVRVSHNGHPNKKYVLSGPTCDPDDTILAEVWLPETKVGDKLYILNTGAYSFVYATHFHGFAPPDMHFISKGESLETLWGYKRADGGFVPEYDEQKRYVYEHEGQVAVVYFALRTVPDKWLEPLWKIYNESLHIDDAVQLQSCYDHDSFIDTLKDHDYGKGLLVVDDEPVALILVALTLEKASIAYINPDFIRQHFPKEVENRKFCYITTFFISSRLRNLGFVKLMCAALIDGMHEKNYIIGGDMSDSRLFIPDMMESISEEIGRPVKKHLMGTQSYFAFTCEPSSGEVRLPEGVKICRGRSVEAEAECYGGST